MALKIHTGDPEKDKVWASISNMKYADLKSAVIQRGMPFDEVVNGTFPSHSSWLLTHWATKPSKERLKEFDQHMDRLLKDKGYKKSSPIRKFKQFEPEYAQQEAAAKRAEEEAKKPKIEKPKKEKKKKDAQFGIYEGTKKDYTYKLTQKVYTDFYSKYKDLGLLVKKFSGQLSTKVAKKFPGANEKSVKIWMKRAMDTIHEATQKKTK